MNELLLFEFILTSIDLIEAMEDVKRSEIKEIFRKITATSTGDYQRNALKLLQFLLPLSIED